MRVYNYYSFTVIAAYLLDDTFAFVSSKYPTYVSQRVSPTSTTSPLKESSTTTSHDNNDSFNIEQYFNFPLDDWQIKAGDEIIKGHNVITCAPTGAGKTVVGEIALHYAFANNKDSIYTTPLKALSNQKFMELRKIFGAENVGLSTGDMSINRGAKVMVMTTEVYRNMAWRAASSVEVYSEEDADIINKDDNDLANLAIVVLDEFHYMGQPGRGGVWEECVITSPSHTQIVGLSATLPNANDISSWMTSVTKQTTLVECLGARPVPLRYMFATRDGLEFLFKDENAGPGSPKGLLGLRGDGIPPSSGKLSKKKKRNDDDTININFTPVGLTLNPRLKTMIQRRSEKINRMIAKKSLQAEFDRNNYRNGSENKSYGNKRRVLSTKEEQREREKLLKSEMRKAVPSLHFLLRKLKQRSLLPAIFFIFSRAGCDSAAESICYYMRQESDVFRRKISSGIEGVRDNDYSNKGKSRQRGNKERRREDLNDDEIDLVQDRSGRTFRRNSNYISEDVISSILDSSDFISQEEIMKELNPLEAKNFQGYADRGLLNYDQVREVAVRVKAFNSENEEIRFSDNVIDQLLHGVGSHHAGQLPAHKAFVESLFRAQLMKVVFATETLAAGINMPARTTVICSMAKRGDGQSMNLLETSNMLQMAGRAGRRGMDIEGTCVVVSTPFEGPNEAIDILTSAIKPVQSQFSPSYSLAVNLIARGDGQLDVAQQLVRKSFAMWGKERAEETIESVKQMHGDQFDEVVERASHVQFLDQLKRLIEDELDLGSKKPRKVLEVLDDKTLLKKASKSFSGLSQIFDLELNTLNYLKQEADSIKSIDLGLDQDGLLDLLREDNQSVSEEIEIQRKRIEKVKEDMSSHVMSAMTIFANDFLNNPKEDYNQLRTALALSRKSSPEQNTMTSNNVSTNELCKFSKSVVQSSRNLRKQQNELKREGVDDSSLIQHLKNTEVGDDAWEDMLSLLNVLQSYGCIVPLNNAKDVSSENFKITIAGDNIASLGLDNSLWILVAMGGAWDCKGDSSKLDDFKIAMQSFGSYEDDDDNSKLLDYPSYEYDQDAKDNNPAPLPQLEAATLVNLLRTLEPSEMAGYVSCLVADGFRGGNASVVSYFQNLSSTQQRVIQSSLLALERLMEIQNKFAVDESSSKVQLELGTCEVVTAWAAGCTWNEALELSGLAAGDLVRTLHRALDALRQIGNLSINAARSLDSDTVQMEAPGLHPDIRRICRDAANAMDRYPVKDPLPFDEIDENDENDESDES